MNTVHSMKTLVKHAFEKCCPGSSGFLQLWLTRVPVQVAAELSVGSHLCSKIQYEQAHEIMALFVLRKLILHMRMRSHSVGLDSDSLVGPFVYFNSSCVRTAKALARLRG